MYIYMAIMVAGMIGVTVWQQQKMKKAGGVGGVLAKADQDAFGLVENETVTKRWDAMFYLGKLVPSTVPSMSEAMLNAVTNTHIRGRHIRIGLTNTNRIVFSTEPETYDAPSTLKNFKDSSTVWSKGFRPAHSLSPQTAPTVQFGEQLFSSHPAWKATVKEAPAANIDPQNWAASARKMVIARLEGMPGGKDWTVWIDPEAAQFLSNWGTKASTQS
jgi:hypothetical protein